MFYVLYIVIQCQLVINHKILIASFQNLLLSTMGKIFSMQHFEIWDNLHEMSDPVFWKKKKKIIDSVVWEK